MTARSVKAKLTYAEKSLATWRKRFQIDQNWQITVSYGPDAGEDDYCVFDDSMAEYWKVALALGPKLMELPMPDFKKELHGTIQHELVHLILWQLTSFATNMAGERSRREMEKLEEQVAQKFENIFATVRW